MRPVPRNRGHLKDQLVGNFNFYLFNLFGKEVYSKQIKGKNEYVFNRNSLPSGVYFYRIERDFKRYSTGKLIIID